MWFIINASSHNIPVETKVAPLIAITVIVILSTDNQSFKIRPMQIFGVFSLIYIFLSAIQFLIFRRRIKKYELS